MKKIIIFSIAVFFTCKLFSQIVWATNCDKSNINWVVDNKLNNCKFSSIALPIEIPDSWIVNVEFGSNINRAAEDYHCYYYEHEICNTDDCDNCNEQFIFNLMTSNVQFCVPTSEVGVMSNCRATCLYPILLGYKVSFGLNYDPIISTVHNDQYSVINYTVKVTTNVPLNPIPPLRKPNSTQDFNNLAQYFISKTKYTYEHTLHPGRTQRTVFKKGNKIYIGTLGEGNVFAAKLNNALAESVWRTIDNKIVEEFKLKCKKAINPTLFLFDVSGSMNDNNKWQNAKQSALTTLNSIKSQSKAASLKPSISIRAFDGDCITDPTKEVINFTTNLTSVEDAINNKIPPPGGSTPLPQAIQVSEDKLKAYLTANSIKKGKLIILTDGVSSCGSLRPQGVYGYGQQNLQSSSFNSNSSSSLIRYYAIGFDIAPGSEAERDLQYLTQSNGGKYLNAQNQIELTDAFYKFNRVYIAKPSPAITPASENDKELFSDGITFINDEEYDKALENYKQFSKNNDKDYNGIYNLALMSEANERYKAAVKNYELYLQLNPGATDKAFVNEILKNLRETAKRYAAYNKQVVKSDMEYLNLYFKKIQNGESIALAIEFIGFLKEKYSYYRDLAAIVEVEDRLFKTNANEVFKGLKESVETINRNPQAWDRDATPVLSRTYLNMERLLNSF